MFQTLSTFFLELAIGIGVVAVGSVLYYFGNRLFGRKTGGKRLVIFAASIVFVLIGCFLLRLVFARSDASVITAMLGGIGLLLGFRLLFTAFASDESVEEAFKIVLRSF